MEKPETTPRVLVVDDEKSDRDWLVHLLEAKGYKVIAVADGQSALDAVAVDLPDLVMLDLKMPGLDGFEVTQRLKADPRTEAIPIIVVTGLDDRESRIHALKTGAEEFLPKPVDSDELGARVRNLVKLKRYGDLLADRAKASDRLVQNATIKLREAYRDITFTLTRAAEYRDEDTGAHIRRVAHYTWEIASCLGLERDFVDGIFYAAPLHDVGKIGVPDSILLKPGALTEDERAAMQSHTEIGFDILRHGRTPFTKMGAEIALSHHERWDGTGYPKRLKGDEIPLSGRIMNVCDQYDALRSKRPYKPALVQARVVEILTKGDGRTLVSHFDPDVLGAFLRCADRFAEIFDNLQDEE